MSKNKIFVVGMLILAVSFFGALAYFNSPGEGPDTNVLKDVDPSLLARPHSPIKGKVDAPITIVEFLDPECEACREMQPIVNTLLEEYSGKVRVVVRYLPLHPNSIYAASALEEMRELGKFDEALNLFFLRQPQWGDHEEPKPELLATYLTELGLPKAKNDEKYLVEKHQQKLKMDLADAEKLGLQETPSFFVQGKHLPQIGYVVLKKRIDEELAKLK